MVGQFGRSPSVAGRPRLRAQSDQRHTGTPGGARRKAADDDVGSAPMRMEAAQRRARSGAPYVGRQVKLTHYPWLARRCLRAGDYLPKAFLISVMISGTAGSSPPAWT